MMVTGSAIEECYVELGIWLKKQRQIYGLSQQDASVMLGLSRPSIANIEAGKQRLAHHQVLQMRERMTDKGVAEYRASIAAVLSEGEEDSILALAEEIKAKRRSKTP